MIRIRCYNVIFFLECCTKTDYNKICYFGRRIQNEKISMSDIYKWCNVQGIKYKTKFVYRNDFPLKANIWNLYTYVRGSIENYFRLNI